jgi:hypothetical protein
VFQGRGVFKSVRIAFPVKLVAGKGYSRRLHLVAA